MQVAWSASAVVGVAGAAPPSLTCWDSPGPAHEKNGKSNFQQKDCGGLFCSVVYMGFPVAFRDESTSVSSRICTELQLRAGQLRESPVQVPPCPCLLTA